MTTITTFHQAEERLAESLPGYESRPQQQMLARAVEGAIASRTHLLAEAGTGTGKSLGYLIPAILGRKRTIISTATKALQDQIANKDLPFLHENLGVSFTSAILKGRSNYICGNKATDPENEKVANLPQILKVLKDRANDPTFTGERDQFGFEIPIGDWLKLASDSDDCQDCAGDACYADRARKVAKNSDIVIVNHALYMTEMLVKDVSGGRATFLGEHEVVVFDEAHEIEEYASSSLGDTIKQRGLENLGGEVSNFIRKFESDRSEEAARLVAAMNTAASELWHTLEEGRIRYPDLEQRADEFVALTNSLVELFEFLEHWSGYRGQDPIKKRGAKVARKVEVAADRMRKFVTDPFTATVRWVEKETRRSGTQLNLTYAPIDVSPYLRRLVFQSGVTAILVSATLAVNGKMDYIAGRLGVDHYDDLDVGTPFDYQRQARLYIPTELPDPARERTAWSSMSISRMKDLIDLSGGRALLLFTSISEMKTAYEMISSTVPYRCLMQGQESNKKLAEEFKNDETSVLFATRSFMTGVDFQGDTLKMVIINKLPFPVPTEPITEARTEAIKARGGNDFLEYSIPVMTLILKQAFGRLIRHRNDTGIVAILDPRLESKGYGKSIVKSLPDAPLVTDLAEVKELLDGAA